MILEVSGLEVFYGQAHILHDVGFSVAKGEAVALLGRNGAGKSTTLKTLAGLIRPAAGQVRFAGVDVTGWEPYRIARAGMGWVPEDRRVFADLTIMENLECGRQPPRPGQAPWMPERLFQLFPNLAELQDRPAARTSGGEQQMLTIARTLMGNPRLILLDEPSEGLAPIIVRQMEAAIRALTAEGVTVLLAEPNLHLAAAVASRAVVLEGGRIVWDGAVAALQADEALRARFLAV